MNILNHSFPIFKWVVFSDHQPKIFYEESKYSYWNQLILSLMIQMIN